MATLKEQIIEAIRAQDPQQSFDLAKQVRKVLDEKDKTAPEYRGLEKVWAQLRTIALRYTNEKTLSELFHNFTADILDLPESVRLRELIDSRLISESLNDDRAKIKESIRKAILSSPQRLGENDITLGNIQVPPTIENWMKAFVSVLDSSEKVSSVGVARFFSSNNDYNRLSEKERKMLRRLIELYKYLLVSPDDLEGHVEYDLVNVGKDGLLFVGGGEVVQIEDETTLNEYEELAKHDKLSALELGELQIQYPDRFNKYAKRDLLSPAPNLTTEGVQEQMNVFLAQQEELHKNKPLSQLPKHQEIILPFVEILQIGSTTAPLNLVLDKLEKVISSEKSLIEFLNTKNTREVLRENAPEHFNDPDVEDIQSTPYSPKALQAILEVLLKTGYGLDENETKWHSYRLIQHIPSELKNYKTIITYDVSQNGLAWRY